MVKLSFGFIGIGAIAYIAFCLSLWLGQTRLIFFPQPAPLSTPADKGLTYEDVWIPVGEGYIHGWWLPSSDLDAKTVLIFHGNATNVEGTLYQSQYLLATGLSALMIDYRGYGLSSGPFPNEDRVYEDAAAAWNYLTETRHISPASILLFGHSIGGAIAIDLATNHPEAAGLIVQATFTSMADMVDHVGYSRIVPKRLLHQHFDSYTKIRSIEMPVLFIHGLADETIPYPMSEKLYRAKPGSKDLWLVPEANHNNIAELTQQQYTNRLRQWLNSLPEP